MNREERHTLIDALLACPSINDHKRRANVIAELSNDIKHNIKRSEVDRDEVANLVRACLNYGGGLQELTEVLEFYEGPRSTTLQAIKQLVANLQSDTASSSPEPKQTAPDPIVATRQPIEPELILIPAGEFLMGSDSKIDKDARDREQPQHALYLPDYYIAKTPVTKAQYAAWKKQTPRKGKENHPVVKVSWDDAVAYCKWLAKTTGQPYRLPSEAEWEKAARGTDGHIYPWGNQWEAKRCNTFEGGKKGTTPVGFYPKGASPYGCLDMAGNVWEWCVTEYADGFKPYPYHSEEDEWTEEYLNRTNDLRVLRGGSWGVRQYYARCAFRFGFVDHYGDGNSGFRIVVSAISLPSGR